MEFVFPRLRRNSGGRRGDKWNTRYEQCRHDRDLHGVNEVLFAEAANLRASARQPDCRPGFTRRSALDRQSGRLGGRLLVWS